MHATTPRYACQEVIAFCPRPFSVTALGKCTRSRMASVRAKHSGRCGMKGEKGKKETGEKGKEREKGKRTHKTEHALAIHKS